MNKEQIYDAKIAPLVDSLIHACDKYSISMLASFAVPTEEKPSLAVLTSTGDETGRPPQRHVAAINTLRGLDIQAIIGSASVTKAEVAAQEQATTKEGVVYGLDEVMEEAAFAVKLALTNAGFVTLEKLLARAAELAAAPSAEDLADLAEAIGHATTLTDLMKKAIVGSDE